jgi:hypothetical protein
MTVLVCFGGRAGQNAAKNRPLPIGTILAVYI